MSIDQSATRDRICFLPARKPASSTQKPDNFWIHPMPKRNLKEPREKKNNPHFLMESE